MRLRRNQSNLKVVGAVNVGETPKHTLNTGEAFEVAAGAVLPQGADTIIDYEDAQREDDTLQVYASITSWRTCANKAPT